jgi:hypothetical protein
VVAAVSLVVELCGLPGAGKSFLVREVVEAADEIGVDVRRPTATIDADVPTVRRIGRKLQLVTEEAIRRPVPSAELLRRIAGSGQGGGGPICSRWVQWVATQRLMAVSRSTPGVHLFDEGVTQALWSLGLRGDPSPTLEALRRRVGQWDHPDLVVVLDLPIELVDVRLSQRRSRHSRLQGHADPAARRAELSKGKDLIDRLLDWWVEVVPDEVTLMRMGEGLCTSEAGGARELLAAITGRLYPSNVRTDPVAPCRPHPPDVGELRRGPGVSHRAPG